ncbi:MAG: hypothetical protein ABWZ52_13810 [Acidimicrobiales bacterium]
MGDMDLARRFQYHPPKGDQAALYEMNRAEYRELATKVASLGPNSRELSLAITALEESLMWLNAHIARNDVGVSNDDGPAE